jgi:hypothetical protein
MRLLRYINELFDTKVPIKIISSDKWMHKYGFEINELEYIFMAVKLSMSDKWTISFLLGGEDSLGSVEIEDTGHAPQVFAAVSQCLKMFIKKAKPPRFMFTAKERSRIKLYDKFAKMIPRFIPYKFTGKSDFHGEQKYEFERK